MELEECLDKYWTSARCGKHRAEEIKEKHATLLKATMRVSPDDLFQQIMRNKFKFVETSSVLPFSSFLKRAKLDDYLSQEYADLARDVQLNKPAIGDAEFLLVSCLGNIAFSKESGDLVNLDTNERMEMKGIRAEMGGYGGYKALNKGVLYSVFRMFEANTEYTELNHKVAKDLEERMENDSSHNAEVFGFLTNIDDASRNQILIYGRKLAELYKMKGKGSFMQCVCAGHIYTYMNAQRADFIMFTNNKGFRIFKKPKDVYEAYDIANNLKIDSWDIGKTGMTITLK